MQRAGADNCHSMPICRNTGEMVAYDGAPLPPSTSGSKQRHTKWPEPDLYRLQILPGVA